MTALREGLEFTREQRLPFMEALIARDAAALEALHGDVDQALSLFDTTIDSFHRAGDRGNVGSALAYLAVFFDRIDRPEIAATLYGTTAHQDGSSVVADIPGVLDHLQGVLGEAAFDAAVASGAVMESAAAVQYARHQIQIARAQPPDADHPTTG